MSQWHSREESFSDPRPSQHQVVWLLCFHLRLYFPCHGPNVLKLGCLLSLSSKFMQCWSVLRSFQIHLSTVSWRPALKHVLVVGVYSSLNFLMSKQTWPLWKWTNPVHMPTNLAVWIQNTLDTEVFLSTCAVCTTKSRGQKARQRLWNLYEPT